MSRQRQPFIACFAAGFAAGKTTVMERISDFVQVGAIASLNVSNMAVGHLEGVVDPVHRQCQLIDTACEVIHQYSWPADNDLPDYDMVLMDRSPLDYYDVVLDWAATHPDKQMRARMQEVVEDDWTEMTRQAMSMVFTVVPPVPPVEHLSSVFDALPADSPRKRYIEERYGLAAGTLNKHDAVELWQLSHARSAARIVEMLRAWECDFLAMPQVVGVTSANYFAWQVDALNVVIEKYQKHIGLLP